MTPQDEPDEPARDAESGPGHDPEPAPSEPEAPNSLSDAAPAGFTGASTPQANVPHPDWAEAMVPRPISSRRPRRLLWFVLGLAIAVGGTFAVVAATDGSNDDAPNGPPPENTIEALNEGFATGDADALCTLLSKPAAARVFEEQGVPCVEATRQVLLITDDPATLQLDPGTSSTDGDRAAIDVATVQGVQTVDLVLEDGAWKVTEPSILGIGLGIETGTDPTGQPPGPAGAAACAAELRSVQAAAELYGLRLDMAPTSTQDLIDAGVLREAPTMAQVNPDGSVTAAGPCL